MNEAGTTINAAQALSQWQRLASTFAAPSKTFEDIHRGNRSWWLPFIVLALVGYLFFAAVSQRVGIEQTVQNQIQMSPKAQERIAQASPEQAANSLKLTVAITQGVFFATPLLGLLYAVVISAVLLGTINFGFGGRARFGDVLAVCYYAWLPTAIQALMGIAVMWFEPPEQFNVKNFAPTNPAALFLDPASSSPALYAFCTQIDVITLWMLVLFSIGLAKVAGVKRSSGYIAVFGWWALVVIFKVGVAAAFS